MLPGSDDSPPPGRVHPTVGGRVAIGISALAMALAVVVTADPAQYAAAGADARSESRVPSAVGTASGEVAAPTAPSTAAGSADPTGTRTVQLDVSMQPPATDGSSAEAAPAAPPGPVGPAAALGCPEDSTLVGTLAEATFGHGITPGSAPIVHYAIDYGDGGSYANDAIDGVFTHTYALGGAFDVHLEVTDANGLTASASCSWTFSLVDRLTEPLEPLLEPAG